MLNARKYYCKTITEENLMFKDISTIKLEGANFSTLTALPIFNSHKDKFTKISLLYGRNGAGKSTIAKAFRRLAAEDIPEIKSTTLHDVAGNPIILPAAAKASIFIFDEDFVNNNVRIEENGLGSIVMLGEQADLTKQIELATTDVETAKNIVTNKENALKEYQTVDNPKAPQFYIERMKNNLSRGIDCWADRERRVKEQRRNSSVNNDTYRKFITLSPKKSRDELIIEFNEKMKDLDAAKKGVSMITVTVPSIPESYRNYATDFASELLKKKIEKPELSERDQYLLSLMVENDEKLRERIDCFENKQTTYCPYCLQDLAPEYKARLVSRIQQIMVDEVKLHQTQLKKQFIDELEIDLSVYTTLFSCQSCLDLISYLNMYIRANNELLQKKINNPYIPIAETLTEISKIAEKLNDALKKLENERIEHNEKATKTEPIISCLLSLNDQIAYYDVIESFKQYDLQVAEMATVKNAYDDAVADQNAKMVKLEDLNGRRKRIDIAIDIINSGLKYIFFAEGRLTIKRDGDFYKLLSNGQFVKPKNVSVGERNIIGLCYFFTKMLQGKNKNTAYNDEYFIVIDDPVSSYDLENKIGILSFLKYKLSQFLRGNINTRAILMTHDLLTMFDLEKICQELQAEWNIFQKKTTYELHELKDCKLTSFQYKKRQEYTELVKLIYDYGCGRATEYDIIIGNIMRQALEAFATFEYKKGIDAVSTDDNILNASGMCNEHKVYFKNLMYRIVLNGGSHKEEQVRNMELDFLSLISENEKRRTAQEILCFIYLLNKSHMLAHLGDVEATLNAWCETIKNRSVIP